MSNEPPPEDPDGLQEPADAQARVPRMHWLFVLRTFMVSFSVTLIAFTMAYWAGAGVLYLFSTEQFVLTKTQPAAATPALETPASGVVDLTRIAPHILHPAWQSNNLVPNDGVVRAGKIVV